MTRRLHVATLLAAAASACTAPVAYPRSGEVLAGGHYRLGVATNIAIAPTRAQVQRPPQNGAISTHHDYGASSAMLSPLKTWPQIAFGPFVSHELSAAGGLGAGCELGGLVGFVRVGVEARCGLPLQSALAVALSFAGARRLLSRPADFEGRAGVDLSIRMDGFAPLIDLYVGRVPAERRVLIGLDEEASDEVTLQRTEWPRRS